ncbi:MAG: hydroxymethylglutaryl-CoA lyase [Gammaproteobacteria bacterium]|nr:hydroxymethylglutaryl-CoA lyase [Gammaproteobacteria bacterium]MCZ6797204.1 hydroxymethylglutaryl-CoA lyase [Gammaproteobacteria bacterium]
MSFPGAVKIVEVGPRDGLQNEAISVPVEVKIELIDKLTEAGLAVVESGSFVSPKWVPQMAASGEVYRGIHKKPGVAYPVLVPNMQGLDAALEAGVEEIAIFAAASETFTQKNINCSIDESIERYRQVVEKALTENLKIRGYISCVLGCPYEGEVSFDSVADVAVRLLDQGCYEVSLGDTTGVGTPGRARALVEQLVDTVPVSQLAAHFHDTYGQGLANLHAVLQCGIAVIDSSVAGLGGCPYARGATGNVATEDVLYMLDGMQIETGVDMDKLLEAGAYISDFLGREPASKAALALQNRQ